jgi:hypothetical protein
MRITRRTSGYLRSLIKRATARHSVSRPPIHLTTVRTGSTSTWSRAEIYGDEGR